MLSEIDEVNEPLGEWFLIEDGDGTLVECTEVTDDNRAVLHDEFGTEYIVPRSYLGQQIPRVRGRKDARPPTDS